MQCTWRSEICIKPVMIMLAFSQRYRQSANDPFPFVSRSAPEGVYQLSASAVRQLKLEQAL